MENQGFSFLQGKVSLAFAAKVMNAVAILVFILDRLKQDQVN